MSNSTPSAEMNARIREAIERRVGPIGRGSEGSGGELASELDGRFRSEFGDDSDRSAPRDDVERERAEHFARIEERARDWENEPGRPQPLPGGSRTGGAGGSSGDDFNEQLRAVLGRPRRGGLW